jgi:hypothetical protein
MPNRIAKLSEAAGGNAVGLKESDGNQLWLELDWSWKVKQDDEVMWGAGDTTTEQVDQLYKSKFVNVPVTGRTAANGTDLYLPLFMNDGMFDQKILTSRKSYSTLQATQKVYDPLGFFSKRTGGFKF